MEIKRIMGIDLGAARVGVAISDDLGMLAHPLETIHVAKTKPTERIVQLATEREVSTIVVGVPRNMDGSLGPAAQAAKEFVEQLKTHVACRVVTWDERLSTVSAQRSLREAGRSAKKQRNVIDQAAAQVILQSWLDAQCV